MIINNNNRYIFNLIKIRLEKSHPYDTAQILSVCPQDLILKSFGRCIINKFFHFKCFYFFLIFFLKLHNISKFIK